MKDNLIMLESTDLPSPEIVGHMITLEGQGIILIRHLQNLHWRRSWPT